MTEPAPVEQRCECGRTFLEGIEDHCWRVGGHMGQRCGCLMRALDLEPRGLEHYFKAAPPAPVEQTCVNVRFRLPNMKLGRICDTHPNGCESSRFA